MRKALSTVFIVTISLISFTCSISEMNKNSIKANDPEFTPKNPPKITVLMESLCPYCMQFEVSSFRDFMKNPNMKELASSVEFVPFGNASELSESKKGNRKFKCQHGEQECYGSIILNCAMDRLKGEEMKHFEFLVCFSEHLQKINTNKPIDFNSIVNSCNSELASEIMACSDSDEGMELLHKAAIKTMKHKYVPYILVNDEHSEDTQTEAETNLTNFLCKFNNLVGKVEGCLGKNNLK